MATIKEAIKFPFAKFVRLFNIYWSFIPIWGWFVGYGYSMRIYKSIIDGNREEVPAIRPFEGLFFIGFKAFVIAIVWGIAMGLLKLIPYVGFILYLILAFIFAVMLLQFANTKKMGDGFDIMRASKTLFGNFGSFVVTVLKSFVVLLVFLIASIPIITLIITIPAVAYGTSLLMADWYREATLGKELPPSE